MFHISLCVKNSRIFLMLYWFHIVKNLVGNVFYTELISSLQAFSLVLFRIFVAPITTCDLVGTKYARLKLTHYGRRCPITLIENNLKEGRTRYEESLRHKSYVIIDMRARYMCPFYRLGEPYLPHTRQTPQITGEVTRPHPYTPNSKEVALIAHPQGKFTQSHSLIMISSSFPLRAKSVRPSRPIPPPLQYCKERVQLSNTSRVIVTS